MADILEKIRSLGVIPMVKVENADDIVPLAEALAAGGLPCVEITFRTDAAEEAIRKAAAMDGILVGAGTVLTEEQAKKAADAGARFVVTPGFAPKVVRACKEKGLPVFPGTSTPTDLQAALDEGITTVKFFPAEAVGGLKTLKAVSAPYFMMEFIPTGGINGDNLADYLAFPKVIACGGSWLAKPSLVAEGKFDEITRTAAAAVETVRKVRKGEK